MTEVRRLSTAGDGEGERHETSSGIHNVEEGLSPYAGDGMYFVDLDELRQQILEDPRIQSVDLHLVRPGQNVRILNLMDAIQPRRKIDKGDADIPGFLGKIQTAGSGRTRSLHNVSPCSSQPMHEQE